MNSARKQGSHSSPSHDGYAPTPTSADTQDSLNPNLIAEPPSEISAQSENKCLALIKNCLGIIFPKLLEGLTHPDQRDQLPIRKKKDKRQLLQYERVVNPGAEEDDEEEDEESKSNDVSGSNNTENNSEDQNQFFNEFQSWRSNQSNKSTNNNRGSNNQTEMQEMKASQKQSVNKPLSQKNALLKMSENEIEQQKNMIQENNQDDLFKDFDQQKQRKLPAPPQSLRLKNSPQKGQTETQVPNMTDLFSELETSLGSQQNQPNQFSLNIGSDNSGKDEINLNQKYQNNNQQANVDILEERGWDDEININIE